MAFNKKTLCLFSVIIFGAVLISLFVFFILLKAEVKPPQPWETVRLSKHVKPIAYKIYLHPDLNRGTFNGKVTITIEITAPQSYIAVHSKGLNITNSKLAVIRETDKAVPLGSCFEYPPSEFWICEAKNELKADHYRLHLEFNGSLKNKIVGFYQSTYHDANGQERHIATTKFEPTYARQAFPCFDEPLLKATYDIELVKPSEGGYVALSNMPQVEEFRDKPRTGFTTVKFAKSLPMSTYLACFIVCDFDKLESVNTTQGFPITVYARKDYISDVKFARDVALKVANFYSTYFNVPYPLPKLDLIAIPDFVSGAMENWGLITFRETRLLCEEETTSVATKLSVALTVAHEISHMWFGDLVTMKWWNDLWLNEGFATFMEYKGVAKKFPTWELDNAFVDQELHGVMKSDAGFSSHAIILPVEHPDQITEIFDGISYSKGASIIRMLEMTVGDKEFRNGISAYLQKYKFSSAQTKDLWEQLILHANNMDVTTFMDSWTRQMGFPVVSVVVDTDKDVVVFKQKRFVTDPDFEYDPTSSPYRYKWEIPITYLTSDSPRTISAAWMRKSNDSIDVHLEAKVEWIKVNFRQIGYYVVNYEPSMWSKLLEVLKTNMRVFDAADRAGLLFDAFMLANSRQLSYEIALNLTQYLPSESHYLPWSTAREEFLNLNTRLFGTEACDAFKKYVRYLIKDLRAITWEMDDRAGYVTKTMQTTVLNLGCLVENKICLRQAVELFKQWLQTPTMKLHPELASIILYFGVERTSDKEWKNLWNIYVKERDPQQRMRFMRALCATKDTKLIQRYLEKGKNESIVRSQDYLSVIIMASKNPTANPIVWDFVRNEWEYLVNRYTLNDRYLGNVIPQITQTFSTESRLAQMKEFFEKYPEAGAGAKGRQSALERVKTNIKWRSYHLETITNWFNRIAETLPDEKE